MASEYLASELLVGAMRDLGMLSSQDETATAARLIGFLNREQRVWLTKLMMSVRESYLKTSVEVTLPAGTTTYRVPTKAVGAKVDRVEVSNGNGGWRELDETTNARVQDDVDFGGPGIWYFFDNSIYFVAALLASTDIRITYMQRRNRIVAAEETREVASFNANTRTITLADTTVPDDFLTTATNYDIVQGSPHFDTLGSSLSATRSGQVLTFSGALPDDLAAGDYVALAGETPICQVPVELQDVLCFRAIFVYLRATGDPKADKVKEDLAELEQSALQLMTPRAESHEDFVINYSAPGWRRGTRRRR